MAECKEAVPRWKVRLTNGFDPNVCRGSSPGSAETFGESSDYSTHSVPLTSRPDIQEYYSHEETFATKRDLMNNICEYWHLEKMRVVKGSEKNGGNL